MTADAVLESVNLSDTPSAVAGRIEREEAIQMLKGKRQARDSFSGHHGHQQRSNPGGPSPQVRGVLNFAVTTQGEKIRGPFGPKAFCFQGRAANERRVGLKPCETLAVWAIPRHLNADTVSSKQFRTVTTRATCLSTVESSYFRAKVSLLEPNQWGFMGRIDKGTQKKECG